MGNKRPRKRKYKQSNSVKTGLMVNVRFDRDKIWFNKLNHNIIIADLIRGLKEINGEQKHFKIDFSNIQGQVYPNVLVPLCAILDYYKSKGYSFQYLNMPTFFSNLNFPNAKTYTDGDTILNRVWRFSSLDIASMVRAYRNELIKGDTFPKGFINATEWALNEVMDNVINHSNVEVGYVMGQIHTNSKHIAFTVFDMGQGIFNSFKNSGHNPPDAVEAIVLSLKESVTRDTSIGQGNGLYGLSTLIKQGDSRLNITSGEGFYSYGRGREKTFARCPVFSDSVCMTTVDFMLDYSQEISFEKMLFFNGKVHTLPALFIEDLEGIDDKIVINIKEKSNGTGTRKAAAELKNLILNILKEEPKYIILDFCGIEVISSSYADELLAKLFCALGLFQFTRLIKIIGLSQQQQLILQKSVIQRIVEDYNAELGSVKESI